MSKQNSITLTILGGGKEIGANSYLLDWKGTRIVLDCGLDITKGGFETLPNFDILGKLEVDAAIISHSHIDHVGSLPILIDTYLQRGHRVHVTVPSRRLIPLMLADSAKMQENVYLPAEDHYYEWCLDRESVASMFYRRNVFAAHNYGEKFRLSPDLYASFFPSGHILGAAGIVISDGKHTFIYTGDICKHDQTIHPGCMLPTVSDTDFLLIESTRGSVESDPNRDRPGQLRLLAAEITETLNRGGHALLPSFALGKTQELIITLANMKMDGFIPAGAPVLYHQGLTTAVNKVYNTFSEFLTGFDPAIFRTACRKVTAFTNGDEFRSAWELTDRPSIFVFTSGMASRGSPSARLAEELIQTENSGIFFTSYIAPEEFGYELATVETGDYVQPDLKSDRRVKVNCRHRRRFSLSSHSMRDDLLQIADHFNPKVSVWVHGEPSSTQWLSTGFSGHHPEAVSLQPVSGETIDLTDGGKTIGHPDK
ncbi:MAG: MBL fold metallo-hydrolase [Desulfomonile tiedjei]|uniref:MBL fold metallo-hydrolase n=1 Tax=Desulfomonile tiedjei TaxID=2358 RepID=A0A9D6V5W0_9BACT|nr:MBL fold metallo-hydrolase [Desulfomonile tiedjei]